MLADLGRRLAAAPPVARLGMAIVACAAASAVVMILPPSLWLPSGTLVYLVAVLAVSVIGGRVAGVAASVGSFLVFDYLFVEPRFSLHITDPNEWVALVAFLVVAAVTSQLAAAQRDRLLDAEAREQEARLLHDLTDLLAWRSFADALGAVSERLRLELGADAVRINVGAQGGVSEWAEAGTPEGRTALRSIPARLSVLGEGQPASAEESGSPGRWLRVQSAHRPSGALPRGVARVPIRRGEEMLGDLLVKWRSATDLGEHHARLLDTAAGQLAVATERERLRTRAVEAEILERTSDLKSALLDAVSHDLRTPLSSIIGSAGSLLQSDVDWAPEERREFLETIEQEAERLNRIVGNLLNLGRVRGGAIVPIRDWHDPVMVLREALQRLEPVTREHRFMVDVPDELPPAFLDPVEIDQVIANLVENAVKYTPRGAEIAVSARVAGDELYVSVEDGGLGVPEHALPHLFEPFYRAPSARDVGGSGVGLAVAHGLVSAHAGRIWAENVPGRGARFSFIIPSGPPVGDSVQ